MIAHVDGTVAEKFAGALIVDVAGIGYEVTVAAGEYDTAQLGQGIKLYTYHHIREQSQELFGFSSLAAKKLFELLITVQSVGPKAAIAILSLDSAEVVRNAIANADSVYLAKASGVGKKTAEGVVVKLSDKVGMPIIYHQTTPTQTELDTSDEALEALIALGYTLNDATKALDGIDHSLSTSQRVREALRQ
ncbi:MAG TPA: Holliday junction branch migration protein RuvA [Candidatus Saccharimonas sp.]|jgi:Holliday junction DNA helicase RuvA|nr:Holliday junction branch migration protein RuvA [Candidatus Saccharimonas sp.]